MITFFSTPETGLAFQQSAVACATRATLANVKSSAMTARQPSVPNLIFIPGWLHFQVRQCRIMGMGYLAQLFYRGAQAARMEEGRSTYKRIRAGPRTLGSGLKIDAAVHTDAVGQFPLAPPRVGLLDFGEAFVDKGLATEAGVDRHHEQ